MSEDKGLTARVAVLEDSVSGMQRVLSDLYKELEELVQVQKVGLIRTKAPLTQKMVARARQAHQQERMEDIQKRMLEIEQQMGNLVARGQKVLTK